MSERPERGLFLGHCFSNRRSIVLFVEPVYLLLADVRRVADNRVELI